MRGHGACVSGDLTQGHAMARCAAAGIVRAVAATGGPGLWADSGYRFDEAVRNGMALLEDGNDAVRDAFAVALGELAAACKSGAAQDAVSSRFSVAPMHPSAAAPPVQQSSVAIWLMPSGNACPGPMASRLSEHQAQLHESFRGLDTRVCSLLRFAVRRLSALTLVTNK